MRLKTHPNLMLVAGLAWLAVFSPAHAAQSGGASEAISHPKLIPLRAIEERIVPQMRGFSYLGPEFAAEEARYRLKFMRGPKVVWIDIDARTGEVIGKSGF